ncbi:hypothetical protein ACQP0U_31125 [Micromonospora sp. CA-269861]|uniref:hypothetical protein n=1 Tax=Micromonospora sp. CA-269861 TaxID=3239968 RepID=UPI003D8B8099
MSSIGTKALRIAVVATLALSTGVLAASPAQAAPSNCSVGSTLPWDAWGQCQSGTGEYRVKGNCGWFGGGWRVGPWRSPNGISWAECAGPGFVMTSRQIEYR